MNAKATPCAPVGENAKIFANLVQWITDQGGHVHKALQLVGDGTARGIFATDKIPKDDLLISLPMDLVISGAKTPAKYNDKAASDWLRCIGALYKAQSTSGREKYLPRKAFRRAFQVCTLINQLIAVYTVHTMSTTVDLSNYTID